MLGAAVGAPVRYLTDLAISRRHHRRFPWGTFTVNVVGSGVLGLLASVSSTDVRLLVGAGFCGALTTYSTFSYESLRLAEDGERRVAVSYVVGSVVACVGAGVLGVALGQMLLGTAR
jgi:fluoride exporter